MQLFTIVTICYNGEAFLDETLHSIANQTFKDFQHLVWDGGSTDRSLEIVSKFPHIELHTGKDENIADAMNKGAQFATGRYILFIHADDLLATPQTLEMWSQVVAHYPQTRWFYGRSKMIDGEGKTLRTTPLEPYSHKRLRKYNFISHPSTLMETAFFNELGGFQPKWPYCMDYDLWLRAAKKCDPIHVPTTLSCFREHGNSTSISNPFRVTDEAYQIRNCYVRSPIERWRSYRTWKRRRREMV